MFGAVFETGSQKGGSMDRIGQQTTRRGPLLIALLVAGAMLLALASSAQALTYGVGWTGYGEANSEMEIVNRSGASLFRIPIDRANCWGGNWGPCDNYIKAAWEQGITIEPYLVWTRNSQTRYLLPEEFEAGNWGAWSREVVERYGINGDFWWGKANPKPITSWEVWNEPNFTVNNPILAKGEERIQPENYGRFLKFTAEKIQQGSVAKTAHGTDVLFGGLYMPGGEYYNSFLERASEVAGVASSYTAVSIHPYSFYTPVEGMINEINDVRFALDHRVVGGAGKPLWVTELGWGVAGSGQPTVTEAQQAQYLTESFNWISASAATDNIQNVTWYNIRDNAGQKTWADYCGLRRRDGTFRPAWTAFQQRAGVPQVVPQAPAVSTQAATAVTSAQATLNGTVNPGSLATTYRFEYGTTTSYGSSVPVPDGSAGSGSSAVARSATVQNLLPGRIYHYRLVATNALGTSYGQDVAFALPSSVVAAVVNGTLYVKEGNIRGAWVNEGSGIKDVSVATDPTNGLVLGALTTAGHALVKKGLYGEWVDEASGVTSLKVATDPANGPLIGVLSGGHALVKRGLFGEWVDETSNAAELSIASDSNHGALIGVRTTTNHALVKSGGLAAAWVDESSIAVSLQVATDMDHGLLIGVLSTGGTVYVKTGNLTGSWVAEESSDQALALATDPINGPLIGVLRNSGTAIAKQGSLTAAWVEELGSVKSLRLASDPNYGALIGAITTGGVAYVKEGGLTSGWVEEIGNAEKLEVAS